MQLQIFPRTPIDPWIIVVIVIIIIIIIIVTTTKKSTSRMFRMNRIRRSILGLGLFTLGTYLGISTFPIGEIHPVPPPTSLPIIWWVVAGVVVVTILVLEGDTGDGTLDEGAGGGGDGDGDGPDAGDGDGDGDAGVPD